ncbi:MAG TPA: sialidase family protein [Roseateles sp.]|nr:sialidase family protein [Roseateles sp.]
MLRRRHLLQAAGLMSLPAWAAEGAPAYDWRSLTFGAGGFIDGFVFHPRERGLLYCRTDIGGAYRFDAAARRWQPLLDHLGRADSDLMGVLSLAVDPTDANRVYAACGLYTHGGARAAALLASTDRGASWQQHELGLKLLGNGPGRGSGERLQVDPDRPERLLLGSSQDGLLQSTDRGRSFSHLAGFPARHVSLVLFDPRSGQGGTGCRTVYAGSHDQPGLFVSTDGGVSFARIAELPAQAPQRAAFGPDGSLYVSLAAGAPGSVVNPSYAKTGSVWRRSPDGRWRDITPLKPTAAQPFGYSGLDADASRPGRLVVSTIERWKPGDEIFVSDDFGASWTPLSPRSRFDDSRHPWLQAYQKKQHHALGHWLADLKLDPHDGAHAVYGTGYGLWMTHNLGAERVDWDFTVENIEETATLGLESPSGGASLLATMGDVSGAAWDDLSQGPRSGIFLPAGETCRSIASAELNPGILARTSDMAPNGGYLSTDGGASWQPFGPSPSRATQTPQGWRASTGQVAVSARGGFLLWVPERQAALFSRDRGRTWSQSEGWPAERGVVLSPVADRAVEGVFYVHDRAAGRILVSVDGGATFTPALTGLPKLEAWQHAQLVCAPGQARDLWLCLPDGLLHVAGADARAQTLRGVVEPWRVAIGKAAEGAAYHAVYVWGRVLVGGDPVEGLFRSTDAGASWQRINDDRHRYGRLNAMAADPLEFGVVYLAPEGRGVVIGKPRA